MANILIVDDDNMLCNALSVILKKMGHATSISYTLKDSLNKIRNFSFDLVILDVWLPDGNGLDALPRFQSVPNPPEVIILTGAGDPDGAELATRSGVWDYMIKPPTLNKVKLSVQRALEYHEEKVNKQPFKALKRNGIIGDSPALIYCMNTVAQAAGTNSSVLITGETGTGKELFARAIHDNSRRAGQPFVVVDCASLPEKLVESTLFGHEKGAFTGADRRSIGLIKQADKGTLFLDEVGELPIQVQKNFLRVLQEHKFRSVGGHSEIASDFRLVAATNRDLKQMVKEWTFREDLYFRLRTIQIELPPLREMRSDLKELTCHYISEHCQRMGIERKGYSNEFLEAILEYHWPGNVRELINAISHALASAQNEPILYSRHLPMDIRVHLARTALQEEKGEEIPACNLTMDPKKFPNLRDFRAETLNTLERQYLTELMAITGGDIKKACEISGLSRARLYALLNEREVSRYPGLQGRRNSEFLGTE